MFCLQVHATFVVQPSGLLHVAFFCRFVWLIMHFHMNWLQVVVSQSQLDWDHAGRWQRARRRRRWRFQWSNELWPAAYAGDCLAAERRLPGGVCCQWPCCLQLDKVCRRSSRRICFPARRLILRLLHRSKSLTLNKWKQLIKPTCCWWAWHVNARFMSTAAAATTIWKAIKNYTRNRSINNLSKHEFTRLQCAEIFILCSDEIMTALESVLYWNSIVEAVKQLKLHKTKAFAVQIWVRKVFLSPCELIKWVRQSSLPVRVTHIVTALL